jgi:hypothetical protein
MMLQTKQGIVRSVNVLVPTERGLGLDRRDRRREIATPRAPSAQCRPGN